METTTRHPSAFERYTGTAEELIATQARLLQQANAARILTEGQLHQLIAEQWIVERLHNRVVALLPDDLSHEARRLLGLITTVFDGGLSAAELDALEG